MATSYDVDYFAWTQETARLLREGRFAEVDTEHVAEEIEAMGKSDKREVESRLRVIISHMLKADFQHAKRTRSWQKTLEVERQDLARALEDNPSLRQALDERLPHVYKLAVRLASRDTGFPADHFPACCPYTVVEILEGGDPAGE